MSKLTSEIIIAGTVFACESKAKQVLQKYFKSVKKQLAGNEDAESIYEDIEQAVSEKLAQALPKKQKTVTVTIARYVVETTGTPESEQEAPSEFSLNKKQKITLGVLGGLSVLLVIFWLLPAILRVAMQVEYGDFFIYQKIAPFMAYCFGLMPQYIPIITGVLFSVAAILALIFAWVCVNKKSRKGYLRAVYLLVAIVSVGILTIAGSTILKTQKYERISASNPVNRMDFTGCGKTIQVGAVIMQGQELSLFEDTIRSGWVYVGDVSGDINKLPETSFYFDGISCQKLADLQAQHPDKKYFILEIKKGPNGQIFEGGSFSRAGVSESYFGLFIK